ncbi:helicase [Terrabacter sp. 28]|nr:helicase [Terrabacter sp. 28]
MEEGLYEAIVTDALIKRLKSVPDDLTDRRPLNKAEAADRIAIHVSREIERALSDVSDEKRIEVGVNVARAIVGQLGELSSASVDEMPAPHGEVLRGVLTRRPDGEPEPVAEPLTPLLDTALLTNAPGEPSLWKQIQSEIASADSIDVVMAFVRRSGINPLLEALRRHCGAGRELRLLTTTYTGSTESSALDRLIDLGAGVRVSYDTTTTRLHAKAWIFHRRTGFSTALVGSSNLTHSAQATGLEWNVRVSAARNRPVIEKFIGTFDAYWSSGEFVDYEPDQFVEQVAAAHPKGQGPGLILSSIEVTPRPFQERLLELLAVARLHDRHRNLLVAATGTGKTVMAAVDYARLRHTLTRSRLLFVAHREEILDQSIATFRHVLRDASFGEKWVGGYRPRDFQHVFASIQSLNASGIDGIAPDHFDVVIIDEFHHAAATSYERLLKHLRPLELLGLTATPERSDGLPILHWFGDRIAAELRLWDAIDQQHLVPFQYFGIHDGLDLRDVPWRRGTGYDVSALSDVYTGNDVWARQVIEQVRRFVDPDRMRCFGFCVSVEHARFMALTFQEHGIPSVAIWGETPAAERDQALRDLASGAVRAVFSVDLFNEGVDVPTIDTVLMLRPTESPVLFLQQLGRGLRKAAGKSVCAVLDFVGTHRREFRFDRRYRALLNVTRRELESAVVHQFPYLPAGCNMQLDRVASDIVIRSLREAIPSRWPAKVDELRSLRHRVPDLGLSQYLEETGLDLDDIYGGGRSWSELLESGGGPVRPPGPQEASLRRAIGRTLHVSDPLRLKTYRSLISRQTRPLVDTMTTTERRLTHMLFAALADQHVPGTSSLQAAVDLVWQHPQVLAELSELYPILESRSDHVYAPLRTLEEVPLEVHAQYTRTEILAAFATGTQAGLPPWREGVRHVPDARCDLLAFTLDKTNGNFSPTTRYRDYAISPTRIHWESQSGTRESSPTGQRYIHHEARGHSILLFARKRQDDRAFWFLGPARYRGHTSERPMAVTWELDHPLSGDLFAAFAAAVA